MAIVDCISRGRSRVLIILIRVIADRRKSSVRGMTSSAFLKCGIQVTKILWRIITCFTLWTESFSNWKKCFRICKNVYVPESHDNKWYYSVCNKLKFGDHLYDCQNLASKNSRRPVPLWRTPLMIFNFPKFYVKSIIFSIFNKTIRVVVACTRDGAVLILSAAGLAPFRLALSRHSPSNVHILLYSIAE